MPEFDPSKPFSVIDSALAGVPPASPSVIDTALNPPAAPVPAPEVIAVPEFDPAQPFTPVPTEPTGSTPTFDPKAEFQKLFTPEDLKTMTVEELDKESDFRPADFNQQYEDQLNADPVAKQKLLDVYKLREATGRTTADQLKDAASDPLKAVGKPFTATFEMGKALVGGAVQVVKNVGEIFGPIQAVSRVGRLLGGADPEEELKRVARAGAEIPASIETAALGTTDLLRRGARTAVETAVKLDPSGFVRDVTGAKPTSELTNEEWSERLSNDVAGKKAIAEATRGAGEMVRAIGLHTEELKEAGIEVRPEVIESMSPALDITNLVPLGAGAKVGLMTKTGGRYAVREFATAATPLQASTFARAVNAGAETLGKGAKGVGVVVEKAGDIVNGIALKLKGTATIIGGVTAGTGNILSGAGIILTGKFAGTAATKTGQAIQAASKLVPGATRVGAYIGAEFAKGYGQGLLFTVPFMIGADAEEREALLGAAGLGGVARGGVRALKLGAVGARITAEAAQEKLAETIFKEVNQSKPPVDPSTPYGTDSRLDADSARQIAKLDADPARARQARVDAMLKTFDRETARMDADGEMTARKLEKRLRERGERIAKIPEVVKSQQNLLGWVKNLFKDSGVEFYAVDDAGMQRQTGGQSGRGFTVKTGQTIAPDGTVKPLVRVFLNGDVEALPHEMLHALGDIDAPGYVEFRNEVNKTITPDQKKSFETIYNTVHNGGLPEAQWKRRLTPEEVSNEIAAELFSRTVLGEDLSGVSPSLKKRTALFTAGLLEKMGVPLGKLTRAQAKDFVKKGAKIKAGFSTLGLRPGTEAQALGQNFVQGLLKRAAEDALPVASEKSALAGRTLQPGEISRKPIKPGVTPQAKPAATPAAPTPAAPPVTSPAAAKPRNIRTTEAAQGDFAAQRHEQTKIDEAKVAAEKTGDPEVVQHVEEISKAVETGTPIEIEYQSVKNEGGAEAPSGRGTRRTEQENAYIAEAMGALPEDVRELAQKVTVPVRWETVAGKPQLLAMSLDKVIANVHKVAKEAAAHSVEAKIPYEIRQGTLTPEAWHEVVQDFQDYADNQANGYRGDGQKLTRPTEDIGLSIPAENPAHNPVQIPESKANFLNLVQGLKIPFTARETKGATPGNVKGQILAEINARTPQKPTVIRPGDIQKQTFKTSGRDIMEVNPLRNELAADGVPVNSLIEVTERLSTENIVKVTPRPDLNLKAPITDIIRGGFLPGEPGGATKFIKRTTTDEIGRTVLDASPEEWQKLTSEIGGLTGAAYKVGNRLENAGDVAKLRGFESEALAKYAEAKASQDFDGMMLAATKKQFFTEALETATGMHPGKQATIARVLGEGWKPPFPEEAPKGAYLPGSETDAAVRRGFLPDPKPVKNTPDEAIQSLAGKLATAAGVDYQPSKVYAPLNTDLGQRLADFYDAAKTAPSRPEVEASYTALADETLKQYQALVDAGYTLEPYTGDGEPYKSSAAAVADIRDNKHLFVLPTKGENFSGSLNNPMLASSGVSGLPTLNDVFRGVHDVFGHAKEGYQFGPRGEFNAWRAHSEMYSPEAQGALAAETLAQNSWVNFGPHLRGKKEVPLSERPFAEQKAVVVPPELIEEARGQLLPKVDEPRAVEFAAIRNAETGEIFSGDTHGEAMMKASRADGTGLGLSEAYANPNYEQGFVTQGGEFLTRAEAADRVVEIGQIDPEDLPMVSQYGNNKNLESVGFQTYRKFLPGEFPKYIDPDFERTLSNYDRDKIERRGVTDFFLLSQDGQVIPAPSGHQIAIEELAGETFQYIEEAYGWMKRQGMARGQRTAAPGTGNDMLLSHVPAGGLTTSQRKTMEEIAFKAGGRVNVNGRDIGIGPGEPEGQLLPKIKRNKQGQPLTAGGLVDYERLYKEKVAEEKKATSRTVDYSKYAPTGKSARTAESTGWVLPSKLFVPLDVSFHENYLAENADELNKKFGTKFGKVPDPEDRLAALNAGFVRIRGGLQGERRTSGPGGVVIELNGRYFSKFRPALESYLLDRAESIDNLTVSLLNDKGGTMDSAHARVHELEGAEKANQLLATLDDLRLRGPEGQLLPRLKEHDYNPADDYALAKIEPSLRPTLNSEKNIWMQEHPGASFADFSIVPVKSGSLGDDVAKYVDGTSSHPVVVLDMAKHQDAAERSGRPLGAEIQATLRHELAHAEEDASGKLYSEKRAERAAKFLPGGEGTLPGLNLPSEERAKQTRVKMRVAKSKDKFPEAVKLDYQKDDEGRFVLGEEGKPKPRVMEYRFMETPLAREAAKGLKGDDRIRAVEQALGQRLAIEGADALKNPEMSAGTKWYSTARTRLKGLFGDDSKFFAELLGATSARTPVEVNYRFALDAYNQFKQGKFDGILKKYRAAKLRWLNADVKDFLKANPKNTDPTRGQFLEWVVETEDLGPRQANGKKYGANSRQVLRVLDGSWAAETIGPKTPNFAGNLSGSTFAATVDVWAARALHRLANEGNEKPWRILPEMETGVTDEDFAIGQAAYKYAADKLKMKPDALQAVLWFHEKDFWERNGWTRGAGAAKSDFNVLLKETEKGAGGIFKMKTPQMALDFNLQPGDIVIKKKR